MHVVNVGYNSLFIGEIGIPDWDMFTSLHEVCIYIFIYTDRWIDR